MAADEGGDLYELVRTLGGSKIKMTERSGKASAATTLPELAAQRDNVGAI